MVAQNLKQLVFKFQNSIRIQILAISLFTILFGVLFRVMSDESSFYDSCTDQNFVSWSRSTSNSLFSILLLQFIIFVIYLTSPIQQETFNIFCCFSLYLLLVCLFGLVVSDNSRCGQLHVLAKTFYILTFIGLGAIVPYIVYKKVMKYKKNKQAQEN